MAAEEFAATLRHPSALFADTLTRPEQLKSLPRDFLTWVCRIAPPLQVAPDPDDVNTCRIYREGNQNLIAWLAGSPLKKFVYTSSTSVYGQNDGSAVTESSPAQPDAGTARILVETENILLEAARKTFPAVILLRRRHLYGPARGPSPFHAPSCVVKPASKARAAGF